jgi:hypothetical protein
MDIFKSENREFEYPQRNVLLLENSASRGNLCYKGLESGSPGFGRAIAGQPLAYPDKVDRRSCQDILEMGVATPMYSACRTPRARTAWELASSIETRPMG